MKKLLPFIILLLAFSAFGQTKKGFAPKFSQTSFDIKLKQLPPNFLGNDAAQVFDALAILAAEVDRNCGKFEKRADCQDRLNGLYERKLWNSVTASDTLAFSLPVGDCEYNADTEVMKCLEFSSILANIRKEFIWSHKLIESSSYIGENAFGVKRKIEFKKFENLLINFQRNSHIQFKLEKISPTLAQKLMPDLRILLIGSPASPFAKITEANYEPTLDNPRKTVGDNKSIIIEAAEVWLYELKTGKIHGKL